MIRISRPFQLGSTIEAAEVAADVATQAELDAIAVADKWASGSSSSGVAGTSVCSITAAAGKRLVAIDGVASVAAAANTGLTVRVTYSDDTQDTFDTAGSSGSNVIVGRAGVMLQDGATGVWATYAFNATKAVKAIALLTHNTGTGARAGRLSALEIGTA